MADMSHYSRKEKVIAVSASLSPHLFALLCIFIPLSENRLAAVIGSLLYALGLIGFMVAVSSYVKTPPGKPVTRGIYGISRNPMYLTALTAFMGITVMTLNFPLALLLIVRWVLNHRMVLAEESPCLKCFGEDYERYMQNTPRYLLP